MMACKANLFFAHKVWFNLQASLVNKHDEAQVMKVFHLSSLLEYLVEKSEEKLYIANSQHVLKLIQRCELTGMLPTELAAILKQEEEHRKALHKRQEPEEAKLKLGVLGFLWPKKRGDTPSSSLSEKKSSSARLDTEEGSEHSERIPGSHLRQLQSFLIGDLGLKLRPYTKVIGVESQDLFSSFVSLEEGHSGFATRAFLSTPDFVTDLTEVSVRVTKNPTKMPFL